MNKKQALRGIAFILTTVLLLLLMCDIFEYKSSHISERYEAFIDLPENTVDAVYVGSSAVDRYWIPSKAFDDYGMTVYPLSTDRQPLWLVKTLIEDAYKRQEPQLVIIDIRSFCMDPREKKKTMDIASRKVIDMLGFFSSSRQDAIDRTLSAMRMIDSDWDASAMSYYLSFICYHNRWETEYIMPDDLL
ncbi:MAG: hypothetical protein IJP17_08300, partial [Clostridia bacterium]|nr:hypothetical protein [Clostridia bacterium]